MKPEELTALRAKINDARSKRDRAEGEKETLIKQLQSKYGVKTVKAAQDKLLKMEDELAATETQIDELAAKIEAIMKEDEGE